MYYVYLSSHSRSQSVKGITECSFDSALTFWFPSSTFYFWEIWEYRGTLAVTSCYLYSQLDIAIMILNTTSQIGFMKGSTLHGNGNIIPNVVSLISWSCWYKEIPHEQRVKAPNRLRMAGNNPLPPPFGQMTFCVLSAAIGGAMPQAAPATTQNPRNGAVAVWHELSRCHTIQSWYSVQCK